MGARRLRNRSWPVLLVALIAAVSAAVLSDANVHDLDPRVWDLLQPLFGET
jgi:hypothetical protein